MVSLHWIQDNFEHFTKFHLVSVDLFFLAQVLNYKNIVNIINNSFDLLILKLHLLLLLLNPFCALYHIMYTIRLYKSKLFKKYIYTYRIWINKIVIMINLADLLLLSELLLYLHLCILDRISIFLLIQALVTVYTLKVLLVLWELGLAGLIKLLLLVMHHPGVLGVYILLMGLSVWRILWWCIMYNLMMLICSGRLQVLSVMSIW